MRILIMKLSPLEANRSSVYRTLALAKGLQLLGHNIFFVNTPVSDTNILSKELEFMENFNITKTPNNSAYDFVISGIGENYLKKILLNILRKAWHAIMLYDYTYSIARNIKLDILKETKFDYIISSSDPKTSHIAIQQLIKQGLKYDKWIQYWGDPMTIDITNKSIHSKLYIKRAERKILKIADKVIYVSPFTLNVQKQLFPHLACKMSFLPIPYMEKKIYPKTKNKAYTIGYYGAYNSSIRNIIPLYNACTQIGDNIHLDIVGDSDLILKETDNIKVYPRGDISEFEKNADLLVCMLNRQGTQIPGKIYHYASTNKPILVLLDGDNKKEMKKYLESYNRYIICENEVQSVIDAIKSLINNKREYLPCNAFSPETIAKYFLEV